MRIWDIPPEKLCRNHLLGEHRELHTIWSILTNGKKGYAHHPKTIRWVGKQKALFLRHEKLIAEITKRGYRHASPLDEQFATGEELQNIYVDSPDEQIILLRKNSIDARYNNNRVKKK